MHIKKRGKYWWIEGRIGGKRIRQSLGTENKELAEQRRAKLELDLHQERVFGKQLEHPFSDALLRYARVQKRQSPRWFDNNTVHILKRLREQFAGLNLSEISPDKVQNFFELRLMNVKASTAQRDLSVLKAILNKAQREGLLETLPSFPKQKKQPNRERYLTEAELGALVEASAQHLKPIILVAVDTGGRRSELLGLDWADVSLELKLVRFRNTKNGEDRNVPLTERSLLELIHLGPLPAGPVFTFNGKAISDVKTAFRKAARRANVKDIRLHDLRHTYASRLARKGVPLYNIQKLMGHKSYEMVLRYAHLDPDFGREAIAALNEDGHNLVTPLHLVA